MYRGFFNVHCKQQSIWVNVFHRPKDNGLNSFIRVTFELCFRFWHKVLIFSLKNIFKFISSQEKQTNNFFGKIPLKCWNNAWFFGSLKCSKNCEHNVQKSILCPTQSFTYFAKKMSGKPSHWDNRAMYLSPKMFCTQVSNDLQRYSVPKMSVLLLTLYILAGIG